MGILLEGVIFLVLLMPGLILAVSTASLNPQESIRPGEKIPVGTDQNGMCRITVRYTQKGTAVTIPIDSAYEDKWGIFATEKVANAGFFSINIDSIQRRKFPEPIFYRVKYYAFSIYRKSEGGMGMGLSEQLPVRVDGGVHRYIFLQIGSVAPGLYYSRILTNDTGPTGDGFLRVHFTGNLTILYSGREEPAANISRVIMVGLGGLMKKAGLRIDEFEPYYTGNETRITGEHVDMYWFDMVFRVPRNNTLGTLLGEFLMDRNAIFVMFWRDLSRASNGTEGSFTLSTGFLYRGDPEEGIKLLDLVSRAFEEYDETNIYSYAQPLPYTKPLTNLYSILGDRLASYDYSSGATKPRFSIKDGMDKQELADIITRWLRTSGISNRSVVHLFFEFHYPDGRVEYLPRDLYYTGQPGPSPIIYATAITAAVAAGLFIYWLARSRGKSRVEQAPAASPPSSGRQP